MLRTYFLLAWRNLLANKLASLINIVGLSIAVACSITVFLTLRNFWTLDDFHANGDRIYMLEYVQKHQDETRTFGDAPALMANALAADFPQVKHTVRVERENVTVYRNESVISEMITYADANFFDVFTFPLAQGSPAALRDPSALILSHDMALKYFPDQNPIGQPFTVLTGSREQKQFVVRGVAADFPDNIGFKFALLTGYHPVHTALKNQDWSSHISAVFVELHPRANIATLARQMKPYMVRYNARNPEKPIESFVFDNLRQPAQNAYDVDRRPAEANHPLISLVFGAIALVMMAISCVNYVNISLGGVTRRLKEIGMRKVLGGTRQQLIGQFMIENLLLCAFALAFGLLITELFLIPLFNDIMTMTISLNVGQNGTLWVFLIGLLLFTAVVSGAYPALYVSAFRPTVVFAGKLKFSDRRTVARVLLVGQFALAFIAVIIGVALTHAGKQWQNIDWGYTPDNALVLRLTDSTQYTILKNELGQLPNVRAVSGAQSHVGESMNSQSVWVGGIEKQALVFDVGPDYPQTLGLQLAQGRFFDPQRRAENTQSVLVNQTFVEQHGLKQPVVGQSMRLDSQLVTVAGVVQDFKWFGSGAERPAILRPAPESRFTYLIADFEPGRGPQVATAVTRIWKAHVPTMTPSWFYQKDVFENFNTTSRKLSAGFGVLSGLALLIACMGLYGLATQHFVRRIKEVSVRKVLGATVSQVILLVNREFISLLLVAGGLANALCFTGIQLLLQQTQPFTGGLRLGLWPYLVANGVVLLTAALAVSVQSWKVATVKLAESLKNPD
ncbi:ABC transporter permease [Spirosoma sordidisoli]|uniref:FtsX-like permease family protein n=1 Tax=Spirosoma sordidisoli TaxID=2502893 RepID=A0A4Q2UQ44_9BACT|nr:ABC transporter permease [Spirosoma sordidisoli]RYC68909.1 FtsX-like permease family protein [Spirosoma sordidisoli]